MPGERATQPAYEGWAIVELMGHRQTAGQISEGEMAGAKVLRVDTPKSDGQICVTQFYGGAAIYCVTPCTETAARRALENMYSLPEPVRLSLPSGDEADRDDMGE